MTSLTTSTFLLSLYLGIFGIFASTTAIGAHHILLLVSLILFHKEKRSLGFSLKALFSSKSSLFLSLFILSTILSVLFNSSTINNPVKWIFKLKYFFLPVCAIPLIKELSLSKKQIERFLYFCLGVVFIANLAGFWGYQFGYNFLKPSGSSTPHRLSGLNGMVLTYAHNLSFINILLLGYLVYFKELSSKVRLNPVIVSLMLVINLVCAFLSLTRGAWLSFVFSIPFLFLFRVSFKKWLIICAVTVSSFYCGLKMTDLDEEFFGTRRMNSNQQRIAFFKTAFESFKEKPLFGLGYKQFEFNATEIKKRHGLEWSNQSGHAHNNFFEHLASTGVIGALSFLFFSLFWFVESVRLRSAQKYLIQSFCVCVGISGLTQYTFGDAENSVFIMLVWLFTTRESLENGGVELS